MRKGESALIMIKPKFGYNHEKFIDQVKIPDDLPDQLKKDLRTRRTFFEVTLFDWIVKHDLIGEGSIIKTISQRGEGFNRPEKFDELNFTLEVK